MFRYIKTISILIILFIISCSTDKDICAKFSNGEIKYYNTLLEKKSFSCFKKNVNNSSERVQILSIKALSQNKNNVPLFIKLFENENVKIKIRCSAALIKNGEKNFISKKLKTGNSIAKTAIIHSLIKLNKQLDTGYISTLISGRTPALRKLAALYLAQMGAVEYISNIKKSLPGENDLQTYNIKRHVIELLKNKKNQEK